MDLATFIHRDSQEQELVIGGGCRWSGGDKLCKERLTVWEIPIGRHEAPTIQHVFAL